MEKEIIKDYHQLFFNYKLDSVKQKNYDIYLDFSPGMYVAFQDEKTKIFFDLFINSLKISEVDFYEVANSKIQMFENLKTTEIYRKIKDPNNYMLSYAPFNDVLDSINKTKSEAVFITDGELWVKDKGERDDPWAREQFENWLKQENEIDFYITDHTDAGKEKHIFYMFFIPKQKINNENNISDQFKYYLNHSGETKNFQYSHFSFCNNSFKITTDYKTPSNGGAHEYAYIDPDAYLNEGPEYRFEYHEYLSGWKDMVKYILNYKDDDGNPVDNGDALIRNLFLDISDLEYFKVEELGIKVFDIRNDFNKYKNYRECIINQPKCSKSENNQIIDYGLPGCYDENGKLFSEKIYTQATNFPVIENLFSFDQQNFITGIEKNKKGEILIKIDKNFNGKQLSDEDYNLHRIDIYLKKVVPNTDDINLNKFIWEGKEVKYNRALYNSIIGALNDANPEGKVIYTYYIKTLPNDYKP